MPRMTMMRMMMAMIDDGEMMSWLGDPGANFEARAWKKSQKVRNGRMRPETAGPADAGGIAEDDDR